MSTSLSYWHVDSAQPCWQYPHGTKSHDAQLNKVGKAVGRSLGADVGAQDGELLGAPLGALLGAVVGAGVGVLDGAMLGAAVGGPQMARASATGVAQSLMFIAPI